MFDIHTHILPDLDDGPINIEQSLEMCKIAVQEGIYSCVATPHFGNGLYNPSPEIIMEKVYHLNQELEKNKITFSVFSGSEIRITPGLSNLLDNNLILTLNNTRYILLELPVHTLPPNIDQELAQLQKKAISPY